MLSHTTPFSPTSQAPLLFHTWKKFSLEKRKFVKMGKRLSRPHKFFAPPMSNGVAGGAAATSKGKSGGRMARGWKSSRAGASVSKESEESAGTLVIPSGYL